MVRPAPMQTSSSSSTTIPSRRRSPRSARRSGGGSPGGGLPYALVLVLVLVGAQAVDVARDRAALAALREVPGVVPPVDQDVQVLWTPEEALESLLWWDLGADGALVGLERPADGSQALVAVDALTGERRWTTPLAPARPTDRSADGATPLGSCVAGARRCPAGWRAW